MMGPLPALAGMVNVSEVAEAAVTTQGLSLSVTVLAAGSVLKPVPARVTEVFLEPVSGLMAAMVSNGASGVSSLQDDRKAAAISTRQRRAKQERAMNGGSRMGSVWLVDSGFWDF